MTTPIEGRLNITLDPVVVAPVRSVDAYLAVAEAVVPSLQVLRESNLSEVPGALLAGHVLECLLKAVLAHNGVADAELKGAALRHDIGQLWQRAAQYLPNVATNAPDWAQVLGELHKAPYRLRYPVGVNGLVLPPPEQVAQELSELDRTVREHIRNAV
jgi:hypothetical protein